MADQDNRNDTITLTAIVVVLVVLLIAAIFFLRGPFMGPPRDQGPDIEIETPPPADPTGAA